MSKNIKITENQYKILMEMEENDFPYTTDSDVPHFDGYNHIMTNDKMGDDEYSDENLTTDELGQVRTMDGWNRYRSYGNVFPTAMREGVQINQKDDFYDTKGFENDELNTLTNSNDKDNLVKIPYGIEKKLNILLDAIKQSNLSPKQQAIIVNKVVEELDYDTIPNQWKKELINDIK